MLGLPLPRVETMCCLSVMKELHASMHLNCHFLITRGIFLQRGDGQQEGFKWRHESGVNSLQRRLVPCIHLDAVGIMARLLNHP